MKHRDAEENGGHQAQSPSSSYNFAGHLRREYRDHVRGLVSADRDHGAWRAPLYLFLSLLMSISAGWAAVAVWSQASVVALPVGALLILFIASRMKGIWNMLHEASHNLLPGGVGVNLVLGRLIGVLHLTSFERYRKEHGTHHRHLGDVDKDLDFATRWHYNIQAPLTPAVLIGHVRNSLLLGHVFRFYRPTILAKCDTPYENVLRILYLVLLAVVCSPLGVGVSALWVVMASFVVFHIMRYWSDVLDHGGIILNGDDFVGTRNYLFGHAALDELIFPRNDGFHLVHHLFPSVPYRQLPRLHAMLLADRHYAARRHKLLG